MTRANAGRVEEQWPYHLQDRTPPSKRERTSKFSVSEATTFQELEHLLINRMQAKHVKFVTDKQNRANGRPYASHSDPGVIVFFELHGQQRAFCCDAYTRVRDNARDIFLCLRDKLRIQNRHSADDAVAEGVRLEDLGYHPQALEYQRKALIGEFAKRWDDTYDEDGLRWEDNPWCWVFEFEVDEVLADEPQPGNPHFFKLNLNVTL